MSKTSHSPESLTISDERNKDSKYSHMLSLIKTAKVATFAINELTKVVTKSLKPNALSVFTFSDKYITDKYLHSQETSLLFGPKS